MDAPCKDLFEQQTILELKERINLLEKHTPSLWGKMNAPQMLAHCVEVLKNALGESQQQRKLLGYLISFFIKHRYYNNVPFKTKNVPSTFTINTDRDFEEEKETLLLWLQIFHEKGQEKCLHAVHPMLGKFTPAQWAIGQYKHLDHHLRQFGV